MSRREPSLALQSAHLRAWGTAQRHRCDSLIQAAEELRAAMFTNLHRNMSLAQEIREQLEVMCHRARDRILSDTKIGLERPTRYHGPAE